jgi:hypothetical protein
MRYIYLLYICNRKVYALYIFVTSVTEKYTRYIYCYARNGNLYMLYLLRLKQKRICVISICYIRKRKVYVLYLFVITVTEKYTSHICYVHNRKLYTLYLFVKSVTENYT